jgi:hypothetical protein
MPGVRLRRTQLAALAPSERTYFSFNMGFI